MQTITEGNAQDQHEVGHVHFPDDQLSEHSDIIVKPGRNAKSIDVHLGFLQIKHTYQVKFNIKDGLGEEVECDPLQNVNVRVTDISPTEDGEGHRIVMDFAANKEKLQHEKIVLQSCADGKNKLTLTIHARVLGKGKGKPSLKTDIHCIKVEVDEDSEQSDWQGFG